MYICKHVYYLCIYIYNSIMAEKSRPYHSSFHAHQIRGTMKVVIPWSPSETPAPSGAPRRASGDSVKRPKCWVQPEKMGDLMLVS